MNRGVTFVTLSNYDIIGDLIEKQGIKKYCIDAGGDILYKGETPIKIGLENPENTQQVIGTIDITNQSICSSAGNRRAWDKYHHIISPHTLESPNEVLATWTLSNKTIVADAMATSLFFTPGQKLQKYYNFEYAVLYRDFSIEKSQNFKAEFFK
jgi:thiamine biosynthesis lipoprotein